MCTQRQECADGDNLSTGQQLEAGMDPATVMVPLLTEKKTSICVWLRLVYAFPLCCVPVTLTPGPR